MKQILISILLLFIALLVVNSQQICDCPNGKYFDPTSWKCLNNPISGQNGYVAGCSNYEIPYRGNQIQCTKCEDAYYYKGPSDGQPQASCTKTDIQNCEEISEKQNNYKRNTIQKFLSLVSDQTNSQTFYCQKCRGNNYWNGYKCIPNPKQGSKNYIDGCENYNYDYNNELVCNQCDNQHYVIQYGKQCIKKPEDQPDCQEFKYKYGQSVCSNCKDGLILYDRECVLPEDIVENCTGGYNYQRFQCYQCREGYYPNNNRNYCLKNPKEGQEYYASNCAEYKQDQNGFIHCKSCSSQYSLKINRCEPVTKKIDHCDRYKTIKKKGQQCQLCQHGYKTRSYPTDSCQQCPFQ